MPIEYYITDVIGIFPYREKVGSHTLKDFDEKPEVNDQCPLRWRYLVSSH